MSAGTLHERDRFIINQLQGDFPVCREPFEQLKGRWGIPTDDIIDRLTSLNEENYLSRFGAVINSRALGGDSRLAALEADEDELREVADHLNDCQTVTHNYARDHRLNLWFVLSADSAEKIDQTLERLEDELDRPVYNLPKLTEYYVGLRFHFDEDGGVTTRNIPEQLETNSSVNIEPNPTPEKRRVIRAIQDGLPIERRPYRSTAQRIDRAEDKVISLCKRMVTEGIIKRLGCVPNHYKLGVNGNAMTVLNIPDDTIDEVGRKLGQRPEVTHCYRRPRHEPQWPYNLFAMVHASSRDEATRRVNKVLQEENIADYPHEILFSSRLFKKTGLRI